MNLSWIAFSAIGGAIAGLIGFLLGEIFIRVFDKNKKYKKSKNIIAIIPIILFIQITNEPRIRQYIQDIIFPPSNMEIIEREVFNDLLKDTKVNDVIKGIKSDKINDFIRGQTQNGLYRLSFEDLKEWNLIRIKMTSSNKNLCIALWRGNINEKDLVESLKSLTLDEYKTFLTISTNAIKLEISNQNNNKPNVDAFSKSINIISKKLNTNDSERLMRTINLGNTANDEDSCWSFITLLKGAIDLPLLLQENFLRYIAFLGNTAKK